MTVTTLNWVDLISHSSAEKTRFSCKCSKINMYRKTQPKYNNNDNNKTHKSDLLYKQHSCDSCQFIKKQFNGTYAVIYLVICIEMSFVYLRHCRLVLMKWLITKC